MDTHDDSGDEGRKEGHRGGSATGWPA